MASGAGTRFGGNKLLHPVEGVPMIRRAMEAVPASLFTRAAVVSVYPEILTLAAERGYLPIKNPQAHEGQSASVRLGLSALTDLDGVLFAVCDQPYLKTGSIKQLIQSFLEFPDHIYALSWRGERGNPVIFPKACYPALCALTGDRGGGAVIHANPSLLRLVEAGSPQELLDLDRPRNGSVTGRRG